MWCTTTLGIEEKLIRICSESDTLLLHLPTMKLNPPTQHSDKHMVCTKCSVAKKVIYISPAFDALHDPPGGFHECAVMEFVADVKHFSYACITYALSTDITGVESGIEHTACQIGSLLIGIKYRCSNCIHDCMGRLCHKCTLDHPHTPCLFLMYIENPDSGHHWGTRFFSFIEGWLYFRG